jgi:hypothetical protein
MSYGKKSGKAFCDAPSQEEALGEFGSASYKMLNRESRGKFDGFGSGSNPKAERAVEAPGSQDAALNAITDGISGGGKSSSLDHGDFGGDGVLDVGKGSDYAWNSDSPFYRG